MDDNPILLEMKVDLIMAHMYTYIMIQNIHLYIFVHNYTI
jgi:hypothetical protein